MRRRTRRQFWHWATAVAVAALLCGAVIGPVAARAQGQAFQSGGPHLRLVWARVADHNGELGSVECAEFSPDGRHVATATKYSNEIAVWRVADGALVWSLKVAQEVERVMFSPDGRWLAAGGEDDLLRLFNASDGKLLSSHRHTSAIDSLRWSPDGKLLAAGEEAGKIRLWQMPAGKELKVVDVGAEAAVNEIDFSSDGQFMTAAGNSREIRVWRTSDWTVVRTLKDKAELPTIAARISADGRFLAAGGRDGHILVWNFADGTLAKRINFTGRKIETVCFTPDGQYLLFAGHDQHIRVLRAGDWASVFLSEPADHMEYLSFSRNGSFLASAHQDGLVRLWVWMRGDPNLNKRLHEELMKRQAEEDARSKAGTKN
jgi:WD40 repeat protein